MIVWTVKLLQAIKRAQAAGLDLEDVADACDLTTEEVNQALDVLMGRSFDHAALILNAPKRLEAPPPLERSAGKPKENAADRPMSVREVEIDKRESAVSSRHDNELVRLCLQGGGFGATQGLADRAARIPIAPPPFAATARAAVRSEDRGKALRAFAAEQDAARRAAIEARSRRRALLRAQLPVAPRTRKAGVVTGAVVRYARWFLAAGWSNVETAALFDVGARDLAKELRS